MPRAKGGIKTRQRHKKILERAKGYYGGKSRLFRAASETVDKGLQYAYRDRKNKKREFRALWITRISAAVRSMDLNYSQFMHGLKKANITLDRKALADLAYHDPSAFSSIAEKAKTQLAS
ncbi:MAG: 50S ribosomal protein L20 [Thermodesulfovibrionales bacterium]